MNLQPPGLSDWRREAPSRERAEPPPSRSEFRVQLGAMAAIARRNAWRIVAWAILCLASAGVYLRHSPPQYVASAQIVLEPRRQMLSSVDAATGNLVPALDSAQAESQIQVVKSERNLRFAFEALDLGDAEIGANFLQWGALFALGARQPAAPTTPDSDRLKKALAFQAFVAAVGVSRIGQSYVLDISYHSPDPARAAKVANSIAASFIRDQIQFRAASVERGAEFLQGRIADIAAELAAATAAVKSGIIPEAPFVNADARIVSVARAPLQPSYPRAALTLVVAGLFALLTAIAAIFIRNSFDRAIRTSGQISREFGLECLCVVPRLPQARGRRRVAANGPFVSSIDAARPDYARALGALRVAIFAARGRQRGVAIGLLSCFPSEGASSIAANLAVLLSAGAESTLLVDCDLQEPTLTQKFAPDAGIGLNEMLEGTQPAPHLPEIPLQPWLAFVPAVATRCTADPNIFPGCNAMRDMIGRARGDRVVIVDLPPLSRSSDALAIGPMLDGVIVVVEAVRTTIDDFAHALRALDHVQARLIGVVLNKATELGA